jgi:cell division protein FtsZ
MRRDPDMSIKLQLPQVADLKPRITVIGVGGAGGNAINNMIASGLAGVEYIVANTDAQALAMSSAERRIQLGVNLTEGLGAGSKPEIGEAAAEEALDEIRTAMAGSHMVFIAAGMGGGTGTGAAGVIARAARELSVLTVGIVTKPFQFEGTRRLRTAEAGVAELRKYVDTLIVIPNQNLFRVATEKTTFADAFMLADQVLYSGVACIVDLIVKDGLINLDFADVRAVMSGMGSAMMGTGEASGERRATVAAEEAISNPLLDDVTLRGARGVLLSIIGGRDMTLYEVDEAASRVRQEVDADANIIVGATFDDSLGDKIRVAIVASGMARQGAHDARHAAEPMPASPRRPHAAPRAPDGRNGTGARHAPLWHGRPRPDDPMQRDEIADRLSAAIASDMPSEHGEAHADAAEVPADPSQRRELWEGPGGVLIEEGLPQFGQSAYQPRTSPPPLDPSRSGGGFTPAPPTQLRRAGRRMPDLQDFPPVGQREYRAKSEHYGDDPESEPRVYAPLSDEPPPRRRSLLQRLVSASRGRAAGDD